MHGPMYVKINTDMLDIPALIFDHLSSKRMYAFLQQRSYSKHFHAFTMWIKLTSAYEDMWINSDSEA